MQAWGSFDSSFFWLIFGDWIEEIIPNLLLMLSVSLYWKLKICGLTCYYFWAIFIEVTRAIAILSSPSCTIGLIQCHHQDKWKVTSFSEINFNFFWYWKEGFLITKVHLHEDWWIAFLFIISRKPFISSPNLFKICMWQQCLNYDFFWIILLSVANTRSTPLDTSWFPRKKPKAQWRMKLPIDNVTIHTDYYVQNKY